MQKIKNSIIMALLIILLFSFLTILNLNRDIEQLEKTENQLGLDWGII